MTTGPKNGERLGEAVRQEAQNRDLRVKVALLVVSLSTVILLAAAAIAEGWLNEWQEHQRAYRRLLETKATGERGRRIAAGFRVEMRQLVLPELGTIDRCVSCHNGLEDPRMTDVPQPHRVHPGDTLRAHPPARFGCTVCHRGQGRAMTFGDAKSADRHWDYPLLPTALTQSSCGLCHASGDIDSSGGEIYAAGARLFETKGCRSCHALDGRGGSLGPVLDGEGSKVRGQLPMANVAGPHTLPQWLEEHFADPQAIVPGSRMPNPGLSRAETTALTTFVLSLQDFDPPASFLTPGKHLELAASARPADATGEATYAHFCSTCHDTGRLGRWDKFFAQFIPAVRGPTYQALAEPDYVAANIRHGRQGTIMPPWGADAGGLSEEEIRRVTSFLLDRPVTLEQIADRLGATGSSAPPPSAGNPAHGGRLFTKHCSGCHGPAGEGKLGPSLNTPVFRANASDRLLFGTISGGRRNTAMPSFLAPAGGGFAADDVHDVIAFVRSLGRPRDRAHAAPTPSGREEQP